MVEDLQWLTPPCSLCTQLCCSLRADVGDAVEVLFHEPHPYRIWDAARRLQIGRIPGVGGGSVFNNRYYQNLLSLRNPAGGFRHGGLPSDIELLRNPETQRVVAALAADNLQFVTEFHAVYLKLTSLGYA